MSCIRSSRRTTARMGRTTQETTDRQPRLPSNSEMELRAHLSRGIGNRLKRVDNCAVFTAAWEPTGEQPCSEPACRTWRLEEDSMVRTNRGRVILGGLLAGLVINIVEYITNGVVLKEGWGQAMRALGKSAELNTGAIVMFNIGGFLLGIAAVWLYAANRPRY